MDPLVPENTSFSGASHFVFAAENASTERTHTQARGRPPVSTNEAWRFRKSISQSAMTIQNRINFFKREEDRIWKGLEEVRRQAGRIEDGRARTIEKKLADKTLVQRRQEEWTVKHMQAGKIRSGIEKTREVFEK